MQVSEKFPPLTTTLYQTYSSSAGQLGYGRCNRTVLAPATELTPSDKTLQPVTEEQAYATIG